MVNLSQMDEQCPIENGEHNDEINQSIECTTNGSAINGETPTEDVSNGNVSNGDGQNDETSYKLIEYTESSQELPHERSKLRVPAFIQRKPASALVEVAVKPNQSTKLGIESVCPRICFYFLRDECVEGENCYNLHELPSDDDVRQKLIEMGNESAGKLFHTIIARCPKLLQRYFSLFIDFFVEHKSQHDLIRAVAICEREPDPNKRFDLFQYLINAFVREGCTYTTAMQTIFWRLNRNITIDVVNTLLNMNLVDGVGVDEFLNVFCSLQSQRYRFHPLIISRLMYLCTQSQAVLPHDKLDEFARLIFGILRSNEHTRGKLTKDCYESFLEMWNRIFKRR